jgi:glucosamine--fructose-6-phosphate aminotransferase (isomerizing)
MTELLRDIQREPRELIGILDFSFGPGRAALDEAARLLERRPVCVTGIGSSWHAALAVGAVFEAGGRPCRVLDASELLHAAVPADTAVLVLSRSGKSFEVLAAAAKLRDAGARIVAVTNDPASPLAEAADVVIEIRARPDHLVSVTMYSGLALAGGLTAARALGRGDTHLRRILEDAFRAASGSLEGWREQIASARWLDPLAPVYFLGRQGGLATAHEARLLWEEAAKAPATALTTGGFRHGSQEVVRAGTRIGLWIQPEAHRDGDLRIAVELQAMGAEVLLVGQALHCPEAALAINVPPLPAVWQFVLDIIPAQLAAEQLAWLRGEDCDAFRYCPYVIQHAVGLSAPSDARREPT